MFTVPNTYLGISANKLPYIAAVLEQKNAALTAENVRLQKELETEHALAESLGIDCERLKDENETMQSLVGQLYWYTKSMREALRKCKDKDSGYLELLDDSLNKAYDRIHKLGIEAKK